MFYYPKVLAFILGARKNRLIETVLLSSITCFGSEIRKLFIPLRTLNQRPAGPNALIHIVKWTNMELERYNINKFSSSKKH